MKIGELADAACTQIETIRFYEREGLLTGPARSAGNYRIYDEGHAQRLSFIRHCRALDMNLDEIRVLLRFKDAPEQNCAEVNALLDDHIGHVATRIRELRKLDTELRALRKLCEVAQDAGHCGILNELSGDNPSGPARAAPHFGHIHGAHTKRLARPAK